MGSCAGGGSIPFSRGCFKTKFSVPVGDKFVPIRIPFSSFSDLWSPATGNQTKTCAEDPSVCPTASMLKAIKRVEVWGEGALGKVHLEIHSILASTASDATEVRVASRPDPADDLCSGPVQKNLRYNISSRTTPDVPVPVGDTENLAELFAATNVPLPLQNRSFSSRRLISLVHEARERNHNFLRLSLWSALVPHSCQQNFGRLQG